MTWKIKRWKLFIKIYNVPKHWCSAHILPLDVTMSIHLMASIGEINIYQFKISTYFLTFWNTFFLNLHSNEPNCTAPFEELYIYGHVPPTQILPNFYCNGIPSPHQISQMPFRPPKHKAGSHGATYSQRTVYYQCSWIDLHSAHSWGWDARLWPKPRVMMVCGHHISRGSELARAPLEMKGGWMPSCSRRSNNKHQSPALRSCPAPKLELPTTGGCGFSKQLQTGVHPG